MQHQTMENYKLGYGCDSQQCLSMQQFAWDARFHNATVAIPNPDAISLGELEWEFWVSKLHFGYPKATAEDLETIKEIANRL